MVVVDTNIVVALFVESARTRAAQALFDVDPAWSTEPFALVEFANVLATYQRSKLVSPAQAFNYFDQAQHFLQDYFVTVSPGVALKTAIEFGVSAYDAHFLSAARERNSKLITEDGKLRAAAPNLTQSLDQALTDIAY